MTTLFFSKDSNCVTTTTFSCSCFHLWVMASEGPYWVFLLPCFGLRAGLPKLKCFASMDLCLLKKWIAWTRSWVGLERRAKCFAGRVVVLVRFAFHYLLRVCRQIPRTDLHVHGWAVHILADHSPDYHSLAGHSSADHSCHYSLNPAT